MGLVAAQRVQTVCVTELPGDESSDARWATVAAKVSSRAKSRGRGGRRSGSNWSFGRDRSCGHRFYGCCRYRLHGRCGRDWSSRFGRSGYTWGGSHRRLRRGHRCNGCGRQLHRCRRRGDGFGASCRDGHSAWNSDGSCGRAGSNRVRHGGCASRCGFFCCDVTCRHGFGRRHFFSGVHRLGGRLFCRLVSTIRWVCLVRLDLLVRGQ